MAAMLGMFMEPSMNSMSFHLPATIPTQAKDRIRESKYLIHKFGFVWIAQEYYGT